MKNKYTAALILSLLYFLTACEEQDPAKPAAGPARPLNVEGHIVTAEPFHNQLKTTANLLAEEQVELKAPISGQVLSIDFKEGQKINKGEKIIRLDDRSWKAQLLGVNADLESAKKEYERKLELLNVGGSSQEEVDMALSKMEILKSQLQQLTVNIDLANVTAPFSGQLGMRDFSEGAFLKQGDLITTLSANKQLKVDFTLAQIYADNIKLGKTISVLVGSDTLSAKIYAISPVVDAKTRTLNVRALLSADNAAVLPGAFAEVLLTTDLQNDAILIPTQAVVPSINEQTVYISKGGKAVRSIVTLGNRTADRVHILTGLSVGDTVLTTGLLAVKEGMDLNIQSVK